MIHPTYRRLDEPPKLAGLSFLQRVALIALAGGVYGVERLLSLATSPRSAFSRFWLAALGALMYFSESGRPSLLRLARDSTRWVTGPRSYTPGPGRQRGLEIRDSRAPQAHAGVAGETRAGAGVAAVGQLDRAGRPGGPF